MEVREWRKIFNNKHKHLNCVGNKGKEEAMEEDQVASRERRSFSNKKFQTKNDNVEKITINIYQKINLRQ